MAEEIPLRSDNTEARMAELQRQIEAQKALVVAMAKAKSFAEMPRVQHRLEALQYELRTLRLKHKSQPVARRAAE